MLLIAARNTFQIGFPSLLLLALSISSFLAALIVYFSSPAYQPKLLYGTLRNPLNPAVLLLLALFSAVISNSENASFHRKALASGFFLLSALTLGDFFAGQAGGPFEGRTFGFAGNPVYLGSVIAIGAAYTLSVEELKAPYRFFSVALAGISIATTGTRAAMVAFVLSLSAYLLVHGKKARVLAAASLVPAVSAFLLLFSERLKTLPSEIFNRLDLYKAAIQGIFKKPATGHGFSSYETYFRSLKLSERYLNKIGEVPDSSHSAILDFAFSSGILSFFLLAALLAYLFFTAPFLAVTSLVIFKFLPASISVLVSFVAASSLLASDGPGSLSIKIEGPRRVLALFMAAALPLFFLSTGIKTAAANYYVEKALVASESNEYDLALRLLESAVKLMPHDSQIYIMQARILKEAAIKTGHDEPAISAVDKLNAAEMVDPFNHEIQILKADILSMLGRKEALEAGNAAVFLSPYDASSYYYRGLARVAAGDLNGAVKDWLNAVKLKKDFADAYYSLGYAKETLGDYESAEQYYKMALKYAEGRSAEAVKEALQRLKGKR